MLGQQGCELELVVVDDASRDSTPELLGRLAEDRRVRVVRNAESLGECQSRNAGLEVAEGDYVAFCDDDDEWLPGAARTLLGHLEQNPEIAAVTSWYEVFHEASGHSATFRGPSRFDAHQLEWQNFAIVFGMFRRSAFAGPLAFDGGLVTGGDWDFWLRYAREQPVQSLPTVLYRYRQHGGGQATAALHRQAQGRRALVAKHGAEMSPACRLYHDTVIAGYEGGRRAMRKRLSEAGRDSAGDAAFVAGLLGVSFVASHVGMRMGDPGAQARTMARLVRHDPSRRRHRR